MAKKSKGNRIQVILECTEHKTSGMPGTSRYVTQKNRKNTPDRLEPVLMFFALDAFKTKTFDEFTEEYKNK